MAKKMSNRLTPEADNSTKLDEIWTKKIYHHESSYTPDFGLMLQPCSFTDFQQHNEFPEIFRLYTQGDRFRGLDFARIWSLILNVKHALSRCSGAVAELGVYQGQSAALLSFYARLFARKVYLADTFSGFAQEQFEAGMGTGKQTAFKDVTLENARAIVGDYEGNRWVIGTFPDSVTDEMRAETYAFVSIDCDLYEPILEGLRFFWPRMSPRGVIFVHDYSSGHWPGAARAVDEFTAETGVPGCLLPDLAGSYVLVHPACVAPLQPNIAQAEVAHLRSELAAVYRSRSWRITKPLRMMSSAFDRFQHRL